MVDITQGILNGFATGIGAGIANYLIIRRLETIEKGIQAKINELSVLNGKKKIDEKINNSEKAKTSQDISDLGI